MTTPLFLATHNPTAPQHHEFTVRQLKPLGPARHWYISQIDGTERLWVVYEPPTEERSDYGLQQA